MPDFTSALLRLCTYMLVLPLLVLAGCASSSQSTPVPPNIIFIMADDLGYGDLGVYGQTIIQTPNLDALAANGMRFTNCYSGSPVCAPARSTLMTGKHTGHTTVRGNFGIGGVTGLAGGKGRVSLASTDTTLAEVLKTAGYVTGMTGKWGLGEPGTSGLPNDQGFDEWFGYLNQRRAHSYYVPYLWKNKERVKLPGNQDGQRNTYTHDLFTEFALDFVKRHRDTSFFLYLPYTVPHAKYEIPDTGPYEDTDWTDNERVHAAMVSRLDRDVGRLMATLDSLGLTENTLILFCSDNGAAARWEGRFDSSGPLRGRKRDVYEGGIRTPMIAHFPGQVPAGTTHDIPWYFPDVLPTLADLAEVDPPSDVDGMSVLPWLLGEEKPIPERTLYWEFHEQGGKQALRRGKWKAVRLDVIAEPPGKPIELYDLEADPGETKNIADQHSQIVFDLAERMRAAHLPSPHFPFPHDSLPLNQQADGYQGIWYYNQPSKDEYVYKYSGGLGTYCAKHRPFAIYREEVDKTFFTYGGTTEDAYGSLLHMVGHYDHSEDMVSRPTILLDKQSSDAHDNPVISIDGEGYLWIYSTSHGTSRPSYVHRSKKPYQTDSFERVYPVWETENGRDTIDNFSYFQVWHNGEAFEAYFTLYRAPASERVRRQRRTIRYAWSPDGLVWKSLTHLSDMDEGHYQISAQTSGKSGTSFNYHPVDSHDPEPGLNRRTNLYYMETLDLGTSWQAIDGTALSPPLTDSQGPTLVRDYESEGLLVYLKDIRYDAKGCPHILHVTSKGFQSGPENGPRTWRLASWTGSEWSFSEITTSDNNYDMGSLYIESAGLWRVLAPTETGPQPFNPGGEIAIWESTNQGKSWKQRKQLTVNSPRNHTYLRKPVNAHPEFYGFWADGHARKPSASNLYFCNKEGEVHELPRQMP